MSKFSCTLIGWFYLFSFMAVSVFCSTTFSALCLSTSELLRVGVILYVSAIKVYFNSEIITGNAGCAGGITGMISN